MSGAEWHITIPGRPRSKGNSHRHWNPVTVKALAAAKYAIRAARPAQPFDGPVYAEITFCFAIPKARRSKVKIGDIHDVRPDRGNCLKLIEDAMTGLVYGDDCQVGDGPVRKIWAERDETRVTVRRAT